MVISRFLHYLRNATPFYSKQMDLFSQEDSRGNCGMTKSRPLFAHTVAAR